MANQSILIIDDTETYRKELERLLIDKGYEVVGVSGVDEALARLKSGERPTFILADRYLEEGEPIERRHLTKLKGAAGSSFIVVFTTRIELEHGLDYEIYDRGAMRVLDRGLMEQFVNDIALLTKEFDALLALSRDLTKLIEERSEIVAALIGANVGVTVIDKYYHCWFANDAQRRLVEGNCVGPLCWKLFHDHPVRSGPCWGCAVPLVLGGEPLVQHTMLVRMRCGIVKWISLRSTPIYDDDRNVIAVREAVAQAGEALINSLGYEERLLYIAQGLVHAGFGRVRIYRVDEADVGLLAAAAACSDDSQEPTSAYMKDVKYQMDHSGVTALPLSQCPYYRKAKEQGGIILVKDWSLGSSPFQEMLELELPYMGVPVHSEDAKVIGLFIVDFVGLRPEVRKLSEKQLANQKTLASLLENYSPELRKAFSAGDVSPQDRARSQLLEDARLKVGEAPTVSDAIAALRYALMKLLPSCRICVRMHRDGALEKVEALSVIPESFRSEELKTDQGALAAEQCSVQVLSRIDVDDARSFSAHVFRLGRSSAGFWIKDLAKHRRTAGKTAQPYDYGEPFIRSTALIRVEWEGKAYGTLRADSIETIDWDAERLKQPVRVLAERTAQVLRDLARSEQIAKATEDITAMTAFSMTTSSDAIWRHWIKNRLAQISAHIAEGKTLLNRFEGRSETSERLAEIFDSIDDALRLVRRGRADGAERHGDCSLAITIQRLAIEYAEKVVYFPEVDKTVWVAMPEYHLRNILTVLLDNAVEAVVSVPGGRIDVRVETKRGSVRIAVVDSGVGIPSAKRDSLMKRPVETDRGSGLGLLIARGTALQYRGDLRVESVKNPTCFVLELRISELGRGELGSRKGS